MPQIDESHSFEEADTTHENRHLRSPLIDIEEGGRTANIDINRPGAEKRPTGAVNSRYWYPTLRYSFFFAAIIIIDSAVAVILWLTGGNSDYFIDNITKFNILDSVFDLAVIAFCKAPIYLVVINFAEKIAILRFSHPDNSILKFRGLICTCGIVIFSFSIFTYSTVKGSFILDHFLKDGASVAMHPTYYACVIWCFVTSLVVFVLSATLPIGLRHLRKQRVLKHYNEQGQELDDEGKVKPKNANLFRLVALAKPESGLLTAGMISMLVSTGVQTVAPLYFGKVVDAALDSMSSLNRTVLTLLGIYMAGAVSSLLRAFLFTLAGQRLVARLRTRLFSSVVEQDIAFFDVNRTGELCNRLSSDTAVLQNAITVNVSMLFRYLLQIIGSLVLMFYLNAALTGVLLAIVPVVSLGATQYGKFVRKMRKQFQDRLAEAGTQAEEALSSVRTVKSFTGEQKAIKVYGNFVQESYKVGKKLALAQGSMEGLFSLLAYGAIAAVLWYGGKLVYDNSQDPSQGITAGLLTSFLLYTLQVAMGFALLSSLYGDFMQAVGASVRIFTLLDRKPDVFVPPNPLTLQTLSGEIEFKDVKFTYPSRPESEVLKSVSFKVERGQMVALVGPSGGGKSTIVSLIERFYDPNEGSIMMDGCDLKLLDVGWFRQKVAAVSQEPTLFACSIRDNIAYGREATDEEVEDAARQANAHDFICGFEDGYNTLVGERGVRLSGGQKQRVAIARALIMNPTLLLLDEATSALDAESEHLVQEAIDRAMQRRTVIVIAHRLSTVRNANKVVVIDKGQIAEMGTHSELLARHGVYKRLVLRQLTAGNPGSTLGPSPHPRSPTSLAQIGNGDICKRDTINTNENQTNSKYQTHRLVEVEDEADESDNDEEYGFYGADSEEANLIN
ncbi:ABC transporter B family protein [Elysia marginata]|uniref:ABC transporter B family protein n=1 Tax=Elysia marginata TaxID=1093978 RepID=A0AAV4FK44_9GAST|nr:ABC transporter B family protein [Elysia marginata]